MQCDKEYVLSLICISSKLDSDDSQGISINNHALTAVPKDRSRTTKKDGSSAEQDDNAQHTSE
jgi:hypothetical protein